MILMYLGSTKEKGCNPFVEYMPWLLKTPCLPVQELFCVVAACPVRPEAGVERGCWIQHCGPHRGSGSWSFLSFMDDNQKKQDSMYVHLLLGKVFLISVSYSFKLNWFGFGFFAWLYFDWWKAKTWGSVKCQSCKMWQFWRYFLAPVQLDSYTRVCNIYIHVYITL